MVFLTMLLIPTLIALGFLVFGGKKVTLKEFLVQMAIQIVVMGGFAAFTGWQNTADTEVLNGRVVSKTKDRVSCAHSYQCNCYESCSGSGKDMSCTTICQTCYEHSYDIQWNVHTDIGYTIGIDTIDRQGLREPPRWTKVVISEPISVSHSYTNYIKGSPDSLFRHQGSVEKYAKSIPAYPGEIYDYYRLNRLVSIGVSLTDASAWNSDLSELNAALGPRKEVNVIVVAIKDTPQDYFYALEQAWIGGKKNDVVLVMSVDSENKIQWTEVMAWTDNKIFQVTLRDQVNGVGKLDRQLIMRAISGTVDAHYVRKPMKDFEYLSGLIKPTTTQWVIAMILGFLLSVGLGIFFYQNDTFNEENRYGYYSYQQRRFR